MGTPFVWYDHTSADPTPAADFYRDLLGWEVAADDSTSGYTAWIRDGEQPWAGIKGAENGDSSGRWVPYVQVDDLDAALARATALGGTTVRERTPGPAGDSVVVADPSGALLALWTPAAA